MKPILDGDSRRCPQCKEQLSETTGILEQCGSTVLPTKVWKCGSSYCEYSHYEPATRVRWQASKAQDWQTGARLFRDRERVAERSE